METAMSQATINLYDKNRKHMVTFLVENGADVPTALEVNNRTYVYQSGADRGDMHFAETEKWVLSWEEVTSGKPITSIVA
jgi:hypothetical protein